MAVVSHTHVGLTLSDTCSPLRRNVERSRGGHLASSAADWQPDKEAQASPRCVSRSTNGKTVETPAKSSPSIWSRLAKVLSCVPQPPPPPRAPATPVPEPTVSKPEVVEEKFIRYDRVPMDGRHGVRLTPNERLMRLRSGQSQEADGECLRSPHESDMDEQQAREHLNWGPADKLRAPGQREAAKSEAGGTTPRRRASLAVEEMGPVHIPASLRAPPDSFHTGGTASGREWSGQRWRSVTRSVPRSQPQPRRPPPPPAEDWGTDEHDVPLYWGYQPGGQRKGAASRAGGRREWGEELEYGQLLRRRGDSTTEVMSSPLLGSRVEAKGAWPRKSSRQEEELAAAAEAHQWHHAQAYHAYTDWQDPELAPQRRSQRMLLPHLDAADGSDGASHSVITLAGGHGPANLGQPPPGYPQVALNRPASQHWKQGVPRSPRPRYRPSEWGPVPLSHSMDEEVEVGDHHSWQGHRSLNSDPGVVALEGRGSLQSIAEDEALEAASQLEDDGLLEESNCNWYGRTDPQGTDDDCCQPVMPGPASAPPKLLDGDADVNFSPPPRLVREDTALGRRARRRIPPSPPAPHLSPDARVDAADVQLADEEELTVPEFEDAHITAATLGAAEALAASRPKEGDDDSSAENNPDPSISGSGLGAAEAEDDAAPPKQSHAADAPPRYGSDHASKAADASPFAQMDLPPLRVGREARGSRSRRRSSSGSGTGLTETPSLVTPSPGNGTPRHLRHQISRYRRSSRRRQDSPIQSSEQAAVELQLQGGRTCSGSNGRRMLQGLAKVKITFLNGDDSSSGSMSDSSDGSEAASRTGRHARNPTTPASPAWQTVFTCPAWTPRTEDGNVGDSRSRNPFEPPASPTDGRCDSGRDSRMEPWTPPKSDETGARKDASRRQERNEAKEAMPGSGGAVREAEAGEESDQTEVDPCLPPPPYLSDWGEALAEQGRCHHSPSDPGVMVSGSPRSSGEIAGAGGLGRASVPEGARGWWGPGPFEELSAPAEFAFGKPASVPQEGAAERARSVRRQQQEGDMGSGRDSSSCTCWHAHSPAVECCVCSDAAAPQRPASACSAASYREGGCEAADPGSAEASSARISKGRLLREDVDDGDGRFFSGFTDWMDMTPGSKMQVLEMVPELPGLYEWGYRVGREGDWGWEVCTMAFYLGHAAETLRSRLQSYLGRPLQLGPAAECGKMDLWSSIQSRGLTLRLRWKPMHAAPRSGPDALAAHASPALDDPLHEEGRLLAFLDYPGNILSNGGRRPLLLPDGNLLADLPVVADFQS